MSQLDAATNSKIRQLCSQGDKLSKLGDYDRAVSKYYEALTLLPEMHGRNNISAFLYASIGEAYWNMKDYENAGQSFCEAYECPGMNENAQITLRIGQCLIECGDVDNARDYLRHAARLGGDELIKTVDRRYLQVLYPDGKNVQQSSKNANLYASGSPGTDGRGAYPSGGENRTGDAAQAPGAHGQDSPASGGGSSSFSFVGEVFGEPACPAESSRFTMSAEDMKPREPYDPFAQDPIRGDAMRGDAMMRGETDGGFSAAPSGQPGPEAWDSAPRRGEASGEKPEKQGFFNRIFGRKK